MPTCPIGSLSVEGIFQSKIFSSLSLNSKISDEIFVNSSFAPQYLIKSFICNDFEEVFFI